jgi:hypothetical protein
MCVTLLVDAHDAAALDLRGPLPRLTLRPSAPISTLLAASTISTTNVPAS